MQEFKIEICEKNRNKVVICSNEKQRKRILRTLKDLNVPIYSNTFDDRVARNYPNLIIDRRCICGWSGEKSDLGGDNLCSEITEEHLIRLFVPKLFNIYGNIITNK